uniref:Uncharacterized protein n=1 Tax=Anguilla anguilla TaxID=7936 RepID=A0A0E9PLF9_ANGAN
MKRLDNMPTLPNAQGHSPVTSAQCRLEEKLSIQGYRDCVEVTRVGKTACKLDLHALLFIMEV